MGTLLKQNLFENGFISFKLKDFDETLYNKLKVLFPIGTLNPEMFHHLKHSIIGKFGIDKGFRKASNK
jgi:hypothetical protein